MSHLGFEQLFELERGLRSLARAEQEKAFNRIPAFLLSASPHPEVVEAGILRTVDFFRSRSMSRKMEIIQSLERNIEIFGQLAFNTAETVRRLDALWDIEDPLMKSLVMRWFALLSPLLSTSAEVLYRVGQSLMSPIPEESFAAIDTLLKMSETNLAVSQNLSDPIQFVISRLAETSPRRQQLLTLLAAIN